MNKHLHEISRGNQGTMSNCERIGSEVLPQVDNIYQLSGAALDILAITASNRRPCHHWAALDREGGDGNLCANGTPLLGTLMGVIHGLCCMLLLFKTYDNPWAPLLSSYCSVFF